MTTALQVKGLCKRYDAFALQQVSFALESGKITGFIGRNGAGKSTTLKAIMNLVHPDGGEVRFFDGAMDSRQARQRIGFVPGEVNYYPHKRLSTIIAVTRSFYSHWDSQACERYLRLFELDARKTPAQLSAGMKVKFALVLALSHSADLLILDEPTSGLDPVSRDDLLDVFMTLADEGKTVLFSTHITSDLDKCADRILYLHDGRLLADAAFKPFVESYRVLAYATPPEGVKLIGEKRAKEGFEALLRTEDAQGLDTKPADLDAIMVHLEKEGAAC